MRRSPRILAVVIFGLLIVALIVPPAVAAGEKTVLNYSIKDARAFLWQIHYPQSTFMTEFYAPCQPEDGPPTAGVLPDPATGYQCDRTRYNQTPGSCGTAAYGRKEEAPGMPTAGDLDGAVGADEASVGTAAGWPKGNPVQVIHGLALGRLGSSPESGGLASMYYVDNSGRRETEAHVESDGFVGNRNDYEERCAVVDAISESTDVTALPVVGGVRYPGPFAAHMLSRADQGPSTYNMASFRPAVGGDKPADPLGYPPGDTPEGVSIVKLWHADGRIHGLLTATVREATPADQIKVDVVRSIISFSSDGTEKGLKAVAKTEALGVSIEGLPKLKSLSMNDVLQLDDNTFLGVLSPVVQVSDQGRQVTIRAPGLFLAAETRSVGDPALKAYEDECRKVGFDQGFCRLPRGLNGLPIPEDPFLREDALEQVADPLFEVRGRIGDIRDEFCERAGERRPDPRNSIAKGGCRLTLGGRFFSEQVVYVAGAILDAAVGRGPIFSLPPLPSVPSLPKLPPLTPTVTPPTLTNTTPNAPPPQVVGAARFEFRGLSDSPWPLVMIVLFSALGLLAVMGRWAMRYPWAQSLARVPPFPAVGWVYRAFLKD